MAQTTSLAAAEDGLLALLQTRAAIPGNPLAGVPLHLGSPGGQPAIEEVWISDDVTTTQAFGLTNQAGGFEERWETIPLRVVVQLGMNGDFATIRDRALDLASEVELAVRADRTLSGTVFDSEVEEITRSSGVADEGRLMVCTVLVRASAILS